MPAAWHHFDRDTFDRGRSLVLIEDSERTIDLHDAGRSIVDGLRTWATSGYETGVQAMRAWLKRPGSAQISLTVML